MKTGFIGLGMQGKYLAINLAEGGFDLKVFDVRNSPMQEVAASGARMAKSCADVASEAEIIQVCVLNDEQLENVVLGTDGLLSTAQSGTTIVVHSTVGPSTIENLAAQSAHQSVSLIDAPVSGSEVGAKNKTMSYMVGGPKTVVDKCRPLFETSGQKIQHVGKVGAGIRAKLAHQIIISINMMAAYEGMRLGIKSGLGAEVLEQVIHDGMAQSRMADKWSSRAFGSHSRKVFYKDLELGLKYANELGISAPGAALAQQMLDKIVP